MEHEISNEPALPTQETPRRSFSGIWGAVLVGLGIGLILLAIVGRFWQPAVETNSNDGLDTAPVRGSLAPDFELADISGEQVALSDLRGRVVLINFWATWCGPCRVEMPALQSRYERYRPDLAVLAVDFDEPEDLVRDFAQEFGLTFNVLLDPGAAIQTLYQVRGYPTSVFVDEQGVIRIIHIGIMADSQLDGYLAEMGLAQ